MNVTLLVASLALSFLTLEGLLRLSGRVQVAPERISTLRPEMYEAHPPYGYRLWPSRTMTYSYPRDNPRRLTVRSNRHGFRGAREVDSPDSRPRILVVGDSMVFGEGVEEEERFTDQLEKMDPTRRIDNLAMTGFGTDLMLRVFEQVGVALKPRVVVVSIYTDDFRRVRPEYAGAGFEIPRYTLTSGGLATVGYQNVRGWKRLRTVAAAREVLWRVSRTEWKLNEAILDRFRTVAAEHQIALALIFLPGTFDTPNDAARRGWLREYADRTGTPFLDLTEPLLSKRTPPLFIPDNWHLNPQGHLVVAGELQRFLARFE